MCRQDQDTSRQYSLREKRLQLCCLDWLPGRKFPICPDDLFKKELKVMSSYINPYTFERAMQVLEAKTIELESLIQNIVPLEQIADVFVSWNTEEPEK